MNDQPFSPLRSNQTDPSYSQPFAEQLLPSKTQRNLVLPIVLLLLGLLVIGGTITVAVAYGQITLGDRATREKVSMFVQSIPLMPKTPQYVLKSSVTAHRKVTRFKMDASVATTIPSLAGTLGSSNIE
jgi:hypothetical protein